MRISSIVFLIVCGCTLAASTVVAQFDDTYRSGRENLGPMVNSGSTEILPIISPDGKTLYFDRKNDSANVGGVADYDDIYYCTLLPNGSWSLAKNIGPPLNTTGSDILYWISPDGSPALVYNGARINGRTIGLSLTHRRNESWSVPEPIHIKGLDVGELGESFYAFISPDGRRLLLAYSADKNDPDNLDIFYCAALGTDLKEWGEPISLGPVINTSGFEGAPFIASDNRTLYFTSSGHDPVNSSDLYMSRRLGESWAKWTQPLNLGPTINTPRFEASLSITARGDYAYISGGGDYGELMLGQSDIYRVKMPEPTRPEQVVVVKGLLLVGGNGVAGLVRAEKTSDHSEVTSIASGSDGRFMMFLDDGQTYQLTGWAEGFDEVTQPLDTRKAIQGELELTLNLSTAGKGTEPRRSSPSSLGATFSPAPIHFDVGSDQLSSEAHTALAAIVDGIREATASGRDVHIEVEGHTDNVGSIRNNQQLSLRRADAIRQWLIENGIDRRYIRTLGRGLSTPVASNATDEGRATNRRVEIRLR